MREFRIVLQRLPNSVAGAVRTVQRDQGVPGVDGRPRVEQHPVAGDVGFLSRRRCGELGFVDQCCGGASHAVGEVVVEQHLAGLRLVALAEHQLAQFWVVTTALPLATCDAMARNMIAELESRGSVVLSSRALRTGVLHVARKLVPIECRGGRLGFFGRWVLVSRIGR